MPSIRVLNISFDCPLPYAEGHTLTRGEAAALNKLRVEGVSASARRVILAARKALTPDPSSDTLADLARSFAFTAASYSPPSDPQAIEATKIARGLLREVLTKKGENERDLAPDELARLVADIASTTRVQAEAARRVKATQEIATKALLGEGGNVV